MQPKTPFPQFSSASFGHNFQQLQHFHVISIKEQLSKSQELYIARLYIKPPSSTNTQCL
jgi:hypothetical protein